MKPDFEFERSAHARGYARVAGVDEVGRGPLAGPVTAAAVVLDPDHIPEGLNDSKKLTKKARERLYDEIILVADVSIAHATVEEIEELNILRCRNNHQGGCAFTVHFGGLNYGQNMSGLCHDVLGATASGIWLGNQHGIRVKKTHGGTAKSWRDPTP